MKKANLILLLISCFILSACGGDSSSIDYSKISTSENLTLELASHNDTKAVDEISAKVMQDRTSNELEKSQEVISDGLYFLTTNIDRLSKNNETMEKAMYYSYYIYSYIEKNEDAKDMSELTGDVKSAYALSYNVYAYIKYIYRNQEPVKNKLDKAKEAAQELTDK